MRFDRVPFIRRELLEQMSFVGFGQSPLWENGVVVVDVVVGVVVEVVVVVDVVVVVVVLFEDFNEFLIFCKQK